MFKHLAEELDHCATAGQLAQFWWRDDDAQILTPELMRLLDLSAQHQAPLSLATIPHGIDGNLVDVVQGLKQVSILQHGYSHQNFAPPEQRKMELGWHRPIAGIDADIARGFSCLAGRFGAQFVPLMVPPWNRIDARVVAGLYEIGLRGLSTLGPRSGAEVAPGLRQINVHVDIMNWKDGRCFAGEATCVSQIIAHLRAKREGRADAGEATGIMTHHLVHDQGCWDFLDTLFEFLNQRADVKLSGVNACLEI